VLKRLYAYFMLLFLLFFASFFLWNIWLPLGQSIHATIVLIQNDWSDVFVMTREMLGSITTLLGDTWSFIVFYSVRGSLKAIMVNRIFFLCSIECGFALAHRRRLGPQYVFHSEDDSAISVGSVLYWIVWLILDALQWMDD
jgi:hypothetical protein